uniref:U-box domain-containing protein n=1 Tax=Mesocestoides corti TaxID=53468 RepID=A0A5K3ERC3_MESCO
MSNVFYGRLILLGTNGTATVKELCRTGNGSLELFQRHFPNGVIPGPISFVPDSAQSKVVADPNRHCVSYTFNRTHTVVVEYIPDSNIDLFQVGRYKSPVIDFHIGDLPASSGPASANKDNSPHKNRVLFGMFEKPIFNFGPVPKKPAAPLSTISRFACRIDINRKPPHTARIYAAGFDGRKNIFLGENATKWRHSDIMDGFTTNGVRIFRPSQWLKRAETG